MFPVGLFILLHLSVAKAQTTGVPLHSTGAYLLDRAYILSGGAAVFHPEIKPLSRRDAAAFAAHLDTVGRSGDASFLLRDNNEWLPDSSRFNSPGRGLLKYFYRTPAHFFEVNVPHFRLRAQPMIHFMTGREQADGGHLFQNQRGVDLRGVVDEKLFFHTQIIEIQARFPRYVAQRTGETLALPGAGFFKGYNSRFFNVQNGYDYNLAAASLGFQATRHFGIQIGHGKHFLGNGYRSLFLSDFSAPLFYLQFDTRVWKFHYKNLFLELSPVSQVQIPDGTILPKKYAAIHYLNFKAAPRLAFGFFEATVFNRSRQFEFQYLNPVILYRSVEGMIGSPDNVLLGADVRWDFLRYFQLYGQFLLDELSFSKLQNGSGWWANKWSVQAGLKYINAFGVNRLDAQIEHNLSRPYTYSHEDPYNSYTHYNQPLSHPLGANFSETMLLLRWQPFKRLFLQSRLLHMRTGENTFDANWGNDPLLNYDTRVKDYGNTIGQGVGARIHLLGLDASWALWHHLFLEIRYQYRDKSSEDPLRDARTQLFSGGIRLNLWSQNLDF